jgi:hypothetical protein
METQTEFKGKKNIYECGKSHKTVTVDRDSGVTPFIIACPDCGQDARSNFYKVDQSLKPTHYWMKMSDEELKQMAKTDLEDADPKWLLGITRDLKVKPIDFMYDLLKKHSDQGGLFLEKFK